MGRGGLEWGERLGSVGDAEGEDAGEGGRVEAGVVHCNWEGGGKGKGGWNKGMTGGDFWACMGPALGDNRALERRDGDVVVVTANSGGGMKPGNGGGKAWEDNRLPYYAALIASGVADMAVIPEAHIDAAGEREVRGWLGEVHGGAVECLAAASSTHANAVERGGGGGAVGTAVAGGVLVLMNNRMAAALVGDGKQVNFVAGRLLRLRFRFKEGILNVIGLYGVSSPMGEEWRVATSETVHRELEALLKGCEGEAVLVTGDLNTVRFGVDRQHGGINPYDDSIYAPWRCMTDRGLVDVHRYMHEARKDMTYVVAGEPVSRIDGNWANEEMMTWAGRGWGEGVRSAITTETEPMSATHRAMVCNWPGPFTSEGEEREGGE